MPDFKPYNTGTLRPTGDEGMARVYTPMSDLKTTACWSAEPPPYANRRKGKKAELKVGDAWGKLFPDVFGYTAALPQRKRAEAEAD